MVTGILFASIMGLFLGDPKEKSEITMLYVMFAIPLVTSILRIVFLRAFFNFDTPKFYALRNEREKAYRALERIYIKEYIPKKYEMTEKDTKSNTGGKIATKDLCSFLKFPLFVGICLVIFKVLTGISTVLYYSNQIFSASGSGDKATFFTVIVNILSVLGTFISTSVIEKKGRKYLMVLGWIGTVLSLAAIVIVFHFELSSWLALLVICFYIVAYGLSAGPIIYIYCADLLPDIGVGISMAVMWIMYMLMAYCFPLAKDAYGITACFVFFALVSALGLLFMVSVIKETKGRTQQQIWRLYGCKTQVVPEKTTRRNSIPLEKPPKNGSGLVKN